MEFILILILLGFFAFMIYFPRFFGIIILIIVSLFALYQYFIFKKNKEKNNAIKIVTKKIKQNTSTIGASLAVGAGSVSISLYEIYAATLDHNSVLATVEERFPNAVKDYDSLEWYKKISDLYSKGTIDSYISAYAGEEAEQITIKYFKEQGLEAEQFASKTHPDDDIRVYTEDGTYTDYSVKSLGGIHNFNQEVQTHPNSTHYVVNKELYNELEDKGLLREYAEQGITIIRGNYSNVELREEATKAFDQIIEKGDIAENIPILAGALFLGKSYHNFMSYRRGTQSGGEFRVNLLSDTFKVGTTGTNAFVGAKIGMLIGLVGSPITAIIGGGIGAIISAYTGSKTINLVTSYYKWSDVYKAQSHFGTLNKHKLVQAYSDSLANKVFSRNELINELKQEEQLLKKYEAELDPFSDKPVTIPSILCELHIKQLNKRLEQIDEAIDLTRRDLLKLSEELAEKQTSNILEKKKVKEKMYGEIFLSCKELFSICLDENSNELERKYQINKEKNPNYPTRLPKDSRDIVLGLAVRNFNNLIKGDNFEYSINQKMWLFIGVLLVVSLIFIFPVLLKYIYIIFTMSPFAIILYFITKKLIREYGYLQK